MSGPLGLGLGMWSQRGGTPTPAPIGAGPFVFPADITKPATIWYAAPASTDPGAVPPYGDAGNNGTSPATPKTFAAAVTAASTGHGIEMADGYYVPWAPDFSSAYPHTNHNNSTAGSANWAGKTLTIWAANQGNYDLTAWGDGEAVEERFERKVTIDALMEYTTGVNITFLGIRRTAQLCMTKWPDVFAGEVWGDVGLGTAEKNDSVFSLPMDYMTGGSMRSYRCEWYGGYGGDGDARGSWKAYEPDRLYPEAQSATAFKYMASPPDTAKRFQAAIPGEAGSYKGWGFPDVDQSPYNACVLGPTAVSGRHANLIHEHAYVHDISAGFVTTIPQANSQIRYEKCWFKNHQGDGWTMRLESHAYAYIHVQKNVYDTPLALLKDTYAPHVDGGQFFYIITAGTTEAPILLKRFRHRCNIAINAVNGRGKYQFNLLMPVSNHNLQHAVLVGTDWSNNLVTNVYKALDNSGARDCYVVNNKCFNFEGFVSETDTFASTSPGVPNSPNNQPAGLSLARTAGTPVLTNAGFARGLMRGNMFELIQGNAEHKKIGNVVPGFKGASIDLGTLINSPVNGDQPATPHAIYEAAKDLPGVDNPVGPQFPSARDMRDYDYSDYLPWIGFPDADDQPLSTLITSTIAYAHGGIDGTVMNITDWPSDYERQVYAEDETTVVTAWTNAATGTIQVGQSMKARTTTPGTNSTPGQLSFLLDGHEMTWSISTISNNAFPSITWPASSGLRFPNTVSGGGTDSQTIIFYFRGKPAASQIGASVRLATGFTGGAMFGNFNISTANKLNFSVANKAGGVLGSSGTTTVAMARNDTQLVELWVTVDTRKASWAEGVQCYQALDGGVAANILPGTPQTFTPGAFIDFTSVHGSGTQKAMTFCEGYIGTMEAVFMGTMGSGEIDISDGAIRRLFTVDNIGEFAKGPNGIQPYFWFVGKDSLINGATKNLGTWTQQPVLIGTAPTAGTPQVWPVPLATQLVADLDNYIPGNPLKITLKPLGYISAGTSVTLSAATGTFDNPTKAIPEGFGGVDFYYTPTASTVTIAGDVGGIHSDPVPLPLSL